eukprot:TRINITY_DN11735_c0_g1_i1.p1 TRINITY_DN11735_c0_g1~~TRINITY_DN11735_c0_g1_i1.p1  ORF type:complete len:368 (-),score=95.89 TRINITY_DN11735_c0_g1_i1:2-1105(-)
MRPNRERDFRVKASSHGYSHYCTKGADSATKARASSSPRGFSTPKETYNAKLESSNHTVSPSREEIHQIFINTSSFVRVVELKYFDKIPKGRMLIDKALFPVQYIHICGYIPMPYHPLDWTENEGYKSKNINVEESKRIFQIQWFNLTGSVGIDPKDESFKEKMDLLFFQHLKSNKSKIFDIGITLGADEVYWNAGVFAFCIKNRTPKFLMGKRNKNWHFVGGGSVELSTDANLKETALRELNEETYGNFKDKQEDIKKQMEREGGIIIKCPKNHFIGWLVEIPEIDVSRLQYLASKNGLSKEHNEELFFGQEQKYAMEYSTFALFDLSQINQSNEIEQRQKEVWSHYNIEIKKWMEENCGGGLFSM